MSYKQFTNSTSTNDAINQAILARQEYIICHLVKFENPTLDKLVDGTSYSYFTDGPYDISFDDNSKDPLGNGNGVQQYRANTLKSVGDVKEATEAKASSTTIVLNSVAFGTEFTDTLTITTSTITSSFDLVEAGFKEGDRVQLTSSNAAATNRNQFVILNTFTNDNKTVSYVTEYSSCVKDDSGKVYTIILSNSAISAFVDSKTVTSYTSYLNRKVNVFRALLNPETGEIIGEPFLIFRGLIAGGKLNEDPTKSSTMSWTITSHWGDFVRVEGRRGVDSSHREQSPEKIRSSVQASEYSTDLGFIHADKSFNVSAQYTTKEQRTRTHKKKKWGVKKTKVKLYWVDVPRTQRLAFNLDEQYIPIVYGVQKIDSSPVFADVLRKPTITVLCKVNTLCEGEIAGILDMVVDDKATVCLNSEDAIDRHDNLSGTAKTCFGRADRGDTLQANRIYIDAVDGIVRTEAAGGGSGTSNSATVVINSATSIVEGMFVSYPGSSSNIYIIATSGTTLTLSEPCSIPEGASLTFKSQYVRYSQTTDANFINGTSNTDIFNMTPQLAPAPRPFYNLTANPTNVQTGLLVPEYFGHEKAVGISHSDMFVQLHTGQPDQESNKLLQSIAEGYSGNGKGTLVCTSNAQALKLRVGASYIIKSGSEAVGNNGVGFRVLDRSGSTLTIRFGQKLTKTVQTVSSGLLGGLFGNLNLFTKRITHPVKLLTASTVNETYSVELFSDSGSKKVSSSQRTSETPALKNFTVDITTTTVESPAADEAPFQIQNMYYMNRDSDFDYWGENHRLLDTAYTFTMQSGNPLSDTSSPEYIVKGKFINCHNYDNSYKITNDTDISSFSEGDSVLVTTGDNSQTINRLVCTTTFSKDGDNFILIANRETLNNVTGVRIFTLNEDSGERAPSTFFLPYNVSDMWADLSGTYLYTVDQSLVPLTTPGAGGRIRRWKISEGSSTATYAEIKLQQKVVLGGQDPGSQSSSYLYAEPSGIFGDQKALYVYYPSISADKDITTSSDSIQGYARVAVSRAYLVQFDLTGTESSTGSLSLLPTAIRTSDYSELPQTALTLDATDSAMFTVEQPQHSFEDQLHAATGIATDGTTVWVVQRHDDAGWNPLTLDYGSTADHYANSSGAYEHCHLLRLEHRDVSSFNYRPDQASSSSSPMRFGTGNIYAFNLASGARDRAKDIIISAPKVYDGAFEGEMIGSSITSPTDFLKIQRTGGASVPSLELSGVTDATSGANGTTVFFEDAVHVVPTSALLDQNDLKVLEVHGCHDAINQTFDVIDTVTPNNSELGVTSGLSTGGISTGTYSNLSTTTSGGGAGGTVTIVVNSSTGELTITTASNGCTDPASNSNIGYQKGDVIHVAGNLVGLSADKRLELTVDTIKSFHVGGTQFYIKLNKQVDTVGNGDKFSIGTSSQSCGNRATKLEYYDGKLYVLNQIFHRVGTYKNHSFVERAEDTVDWVNIYNTSTKKWEKDPIILNATNDGRNPGRYHLLTGGIAIATNPNNSNTVELAVTYSSRYTAAYGGTRNYEDIARFNVSTKAKISDSVAVANRDFGTGYSGGQGVLLYTDDDGDLQSSVNAYPHIGYGMQDLAHLPGRTLATAGGGLAAEPIYIAINPVASDQAMKGSTLKFDRFRSTYRTGSGASTMNDAFNLNLPETDTRGMRLDQYFDAFCINHNSSASKDLLLIATTPFPNGLYGLKLLIYNDATGGDSDALKHAKVLDYYTTGTGLASTFPVRGTTDLGARSFTDLSQVKCFEFSNTNTNIPNGAAVINIQAGSSTLSALTADNYFKNGNSFRIAINDTPATTRQITLSQDVSNQASVNVDATTLIPRGSTFYNGTTCHTVTSLDIIGLSTGTIDVSRTENLKSKITSAVSTSATSIDVEDASIFPTSFPYGATLEFGANDLNIEQNAYEIVKVEGISGNTITVSRAFDSSKVFTAGDYVHLRKNLVVFTKTGGSSNPLTNMALKFDSVDANNKATNTVDPMIGGGAKEAPTILIEDHTATIGSNKFILKLTAELTNVANRAVTIGYQNNVTVSPNITASNNDQFFLGENTPISYQFFNYIQGDTTSGAQIAASDAATHGAFGFTDSYTYAGLMTKGADALFVVGRDKIHGLGLNTGDYIFNTIPDGTNVSTRIDKIVLDRNSNGTQSRRISFTDDIPDQGNASLAITSVLDSTKSLTLDSGDFFPSFTGEGLAEAVVDSTEVQGPEFVFTGDDFNTGPDDSGDETVANTVTLTSFPQLFGLPLEITSSVYEELSYGKVSVVSANFGTNIGTNKRESILANFTSVFGLKRLGILTEEEILIYMKNSQGNTVGYAHILNSPSDLDTNIWKGTNSYVYPYTMPVTGFANTAINTTTNTITVTAQQYLEFSENDRVIYSKGTASSDIAGLSEGTAYFVRKVPGSTTGIQLKASFNGGTKGLGSAPSGTHNLTSEEKLVFISHQASSIYTTDSSVFFQAPTLFFKDVVHLSNSCVPNVESNELVSFRDISGNLFSSEIVATDLFTNFSILKDHTLSIQVGTFYKIFAKANQDLRVSTNPAMQLLDYLTNNVYGKGLDIDTEIDLDSFKAAAKLCDARSNVTLIIPKINPFSGAAVPSLTIGEVWASEFNSGRHTTDPAIVYGGFTGTVAAISSHVLEDKEYWQVTFSNCLGNLGRKWNEWQNMQSQYIWNNGGVYWGMAPTRHEGTSAGSDPFLLSLDNLGRGLALTQNATSGGTGNRGDSGNNGSTHGDTGGAPIKYTSIRLKLITDVANNNYNVDSHVYIDVAKDGTQAEVHTTTTSNTSVVFQKNTDIEVGMYFYHGNRYIVVTAVNQSSSTFTTVTIDVIDGSNSAPDFSDGQVFAMTSPTTDPNRVSSEGNPLVKAFDPTTGVFSLNGYSLYDSDNCTYWRYLGWEDKEQHNVTRHQTNMVINTANTVFDNVNTMLQQFNGILTYSKGRYSLGVETTKAPDESFTYDNVTYTPSHITEDQIIGKIDVTDKGAKNSFNSMNAKIADPVLSFAEREINFFNSTYLSQDNNVPKEGQFALPGVTNYFNARMGVKQELDSSRFSLDISFTMSPEGMLLKCGEIITMTYERFNFAQKPFRIKSITLKANGLVSILASEHSDNVYILEHDGTTSTDTLKNVDNPDTLDPTI